MNPESFEDLERRSAGPAGDDLIKKLEALSRVREQIDLMKQEGAALELTDEEIKMIGYFRRFKLRMRKDGEVFKWQTRRPDGITITDETAQILHPSEVID